MPDIRPKIRTTLLLLSLFAVLLAPASPLAAMTWHTDAKQAEALAAEGDRLIVVDLYAEWCTWCKVLDEQVFSSKPFEAFAAYFPSGSCGMWQSAHLATCRWLDLSHAA